MHHQTIRRAVGWFHVMKMFISSSEFNSGEQIGLCGPVVGSRMRLKPGLSSLETPELAFLKPSPHFDPGYQRIGLPFAKSRLCYSQKPAPKNITA